MHTAALILALILGAVGLAALFGTFLYAQRQARRRLPAAERRERNRLIAVSLLFWVVAALLVNGAAREGDAVVARLMLLVAGLLFVALVIAVARWLRKTLLSLRVRAEARGDCDVARGPGVNRVPLRSSGPRRSNGEVRSPLSAVRGSLAGLPPTLRVYALFHLVTALGIPLAIIGGLSGERTLLVAGLGLAGLSVLSTALALPIIVARRRRPGA